MPNMTGTQLAEAIKAEWPNLPIILASGYAELPPGISANIAKLDKPFSLKNLAQAIATAINPTTGCRNQTA
jgi:FixJ family two-component response regulator